MLNTIELERYRGFKHFRLNQLGRINLLVGKNNSGKTSVLEAIHLLSSGGNPSVLARIALRRGEVVFFPREPRDSSMREFSLSREPMPDASHFFHGHSFEIGSSFSMTTNNAISQLLVEVIGIDDANQKTLFEEHGRSEYALQLSVGSKGHSVPMTEDGAIEIRRSPRSAEPLAAQFISPYSSEPRSLGELWDRAVLESKEAAVIQALKIIEPRITNLFVLSGETSYRYGRGNIIAAFDTQRVPLGSHGEGMRRLLELSLSLIKSDSGYLLVDEIDTGFHYSVMGDVWRLVVNTAIQQNVQVFATTHSLDCLRGLAWLCDNFPELGSEVRVQKIDFSLDEAIALDAQEIIVAAKEGIEMR